METVTIRLEREHLALLKRRAKSIKRSLAALIRELIERDLSSKHLSLYDRAKDLCGCIRGSRGLSAGKMTNSDVRVLKRFKRLDRDGSNEPKPGDSVLKIVKQVKKERRKV
jgi:hypothetical protein